MRPGKWPEGGETVGTAGGEGAAGGAWDVSGVMVHSLVVVVPGLSMAVNTARRRRHTHRILQANQGDQVIVNRIEVVLLRAGQGAFRVSDLGGRRVSYPGAGSHEPVILLRLRHSRA